MRYAAAGALASCLTFVAGAQNPAIPDRAASAVEAVVRRTLEATRIPGAAVAVVQNGTPTLRRAYGDVASPFVDPVLEVVAPEEVTVSAVHGRPTARVGARADRSRESFVAVCAIDNLMKGAASQAVENLLAMVSASAGPSR